MPVGSLWLDITLEVQWFKPMLVQLLSQGEFELVSPLIHPERENGKNLKIPGEDS